MNFQQLPLMNPPEPGRNPLNKAPIVRREQQRQTRLGQVRLQFFLTLQVNMVGRLIHDQQVWLIELKGQQQQPGLFSATEHTH